MTENYDFANLLFAGPCNARCPTCIGKQIDPRLSVNNLDVFPPHNLERFIKMIQEYAIRRVVFSGTTTDPQLYHHEARLLAYLRLRLESETDFSLHTNGRLALRKLEVFNQYDRVSLSFPSFEPHTYWKMMGVPHPPDLDEIVRRAQVPLKLSCLVNEHNAPEIASFLERAHATGIRRVVLRKLYGDSRPWSDWIDLHALQLNHIRDYRGNPVFDYAGMEVTLWDFDQTESRSINLFSSGEISLNYHLVETNPTVIQTDSC
jgi:MoaA/NifB/PqqE/SkfB family radical SAM enzyme